MDATACIVALKNIASFYICWQKDTKNEQRLASGLCAITDFLCNHWKPWFQRNIFAIDYVQVDVGAPPTFHRSSRKKALRLFALSTIKVSSLFIVVKLLVAATTLALLAANRKKPTHRRRDSAASFRIALCGTRHWQLRAAPAEWFARLAAARRRFALHMPRRSNCKRESASVPLYRLTNWWNSRRKTSAQYRRPWYRQAARENRLMMQSTNKTKQLTNLWE